MYESGSAETGSFLFDMEHRENSSETPESDDMDRTCHKRKLDKDGFVHPATPDIPKTSMQYGLPSFTPGIEDLEFNSAKAIREENKENVDSKDEVECPLDQNTSNDSWTTGADHCDHPVFGKSEQLDYMANQNTNGYIHPHGDMDDQNVQSLQCSNGENPMLSKIELSESRDKDTKQLIETGPLTTMDDLFKELSNGAKMVTMQFSSRFVQSENYEAFCTTRLNQLISHAQELEQGYLKQKEVLRQRLSVLSHTLHNI